MEITKLTENELQVLAQEADLTPVFCPEKDEEEEMMAEYYFELIDAQNRYFAEIHQIEI